MRVYIIIVNGIVRAFARRLSITPPYIIITYVHHLRRRRLRAGELSRLEMCRTRNRRLRAMLSNYRRVIRIIMSRDNEPRSPLRRIQYVPIVSPSKQTYAQSYI